MKSKEKGPFQKRTIKTPCCNKTIHLRFPYGRLNNYVICEFCFNHFYVTYSKTKSNRKNIPNKYRAHRMIAKKLYDGDVDGCLIVKKKKGKRGKKLIAKSWGKTK